MQVAIKELKERPKADDLNDLKKAAYREGQIITELGDHRGLPFLFGICSTAKPVCLVMLFHGEGATNMTVHEATKQDPPLTISDWNTIFRLIVEALQHIHDRGFIHNDLKGNNVVLEGTIGNFNPVIIDFGNSIKAADAKPRQRRTVYNLSRDTDSYIAPEILNGNGKPSFSSDVYSFAKMIIFVCKRCGIHVPSIVEAAMSSKADLRPSLAQFPNMFFS